VTEAGLLGKRSGAELIAAELRRMIRGVPRGYQVITRTRRKSMLPVVMSWKLAPGIE